MVRYQPAYDLETVKELAREGKHKVFSRAYRFILNRYDGADPAEIAATVVEAMAKENFQKSDELRARAGTFADIYNGIKCAEYPEEEWYAKVVITDDEAALEIWSMNWSGYIH